MDEAGAALGSVRSFEAHKQDLSTDVEPVCRSLTQPVRGGTGKVQQKNSKSKNEISLNPAQDSSWIPPSPVLGVWKVVIRAKNWESDSRGETRVPDMRRARGKVDYWDDWRVFGTSINHRRHAGSRCFSATRTDVPTPTLKKWI